MVPIEEGLAAKIWNGITGLISSGVTALRRLISEKGGRKLSETVGSKIGVKTSQYLFEGGALGFAFLVDAVVTYREYKKEEEELRNFYAPEIAAMFGKNPKQVTLKDLDKAAKINTTIGEAVRRNKKHRNLNFGSNALSIAASIFVTATIVASILTLPVFAGIALSAPTAAFFSMTSLKLLLLTMPVALGVFLAIEAPAEMLGKKLFGLSEPSLHAVERKPQLQHKLSLPSQMKYLGELQERKIPISQEQVLTAYIAADPGLAELVKTNYGKPFEALSNIERTQAVLQIGPGYNLDTITGDLNTHRMRAQELAFTVQGQTSGLLPPRMLAPQRVMPDITGDMGGPDNFRARILEERQRIGLQSPAVQG